MRNSGLFSTNSPSCKMKLQTKKLSTIARTLLYRWSESGLTEVQMRSQHYIFQGADGYTVSRSFLWVKMGVWYKMLCDIVISDVSPYLYLGVFAIQKAERHRWLPHGDVIRFPSLTPRNPKLPGPQWRWEASSRYHFQRPCTRRHRNETGLPNG